MESEQNMVYKSLVELADGKFLEMIDAAVERAIQNFRNPSTPVKAGRKVIVELTFASEDMQRKKITVSGAVKTKLPPAQEPTTELYILGASDVIEVGDNRTYLDGSRLPVNLRLPSAGKKEGG